MYRVCLFKIMSVTTRSKRRLSYGQAGTDVCSDVCSLCKQSHHCMSTVHMWQSEQARDTAVGVYGITLDDTVCRPCRDDLRRIVAHHDLQPRWEKVKQCKCCVRDCTEDCFAHSKVIDSDVMNRLFECIDSASIPFPTPLCARHYRL